MHPSFRLSAAAVVGALALAGCELVGNIFEAGVWTGVIIVAVVIGGIIFAITRLFK